ncbi:putative WRKY transcription factor 7 [Bidens hawaiensis]|uniref:putative WRKY transcription factor 7 n=1 Tax=Bidens hawaiensis TaxID=980011 RepID=UPI00404B9BDB
MAHVDVELMNSYPNSGTGVNNNNNNNNNNMEDTAFRDAAAAGLQSLEKLVTLLSTHPHRTPSYSTATDYVAVADIAVTKFKKFISILDRTSTGHARFRREPVSASNSPIHKKPIITPAKLPAPVTVTVTAPVTAVAEKVFSPVSVQNRMTSAPATTISFAGAAVAVASPATSFMSSLTGDTDGLQASMSSGFQITNLSQVSSAGNPNLSTSSFKRKCDSVNDSHTKCTSSSGRCHCSKKRKTRMKRVVRVPAISLKMADIPPDDYSWRKYGQKPIKGSPHPRGYYKCSSVRGCPARKHIERALDDPSMLIVTYESEHSHSLDLKDSPATIIFESS